MLLHLPRMTGSNRAPRSTARRQRDSLHEPSRHRGWPCQDYEGPDSADLRLEIGHSCAKAFRHDLPIYLLANRPALADLGTKQVVRSYERHWTPVHLDFIVDDLDRMVAQLISLGASLDRDIKSREYGRIANMGDPFGNGFDLIEFTGPGYDAVSR